MRFAKCSHRLCLECHYLKQILKRFYIGEQLQITLANQQDLVDLRITSRAFEIAFPHILVINTH